MPFQFERLEIPEAIMIFEMSAFTKSFRINNS